MPANGLLYAAPHNCSCQSQTLLNGFNALAGTSSKANSVSPEERLEKGPAYAKAPAGKPASKAAWPIYRGTVERSCYTAEVVAPQLEESWNIDLGEKLTQPVVMGNTLVVAGVSSHTVYGCDSTTGKVKWKYIAGGRIDTSPTLADGYVIFGAADGYVTSLRAEDGEVATYQLTPIH